MKRTILLLIVLACFIIPVNADLVFSDDFNDASNWNRVLGTATPTCSGGTCTFIGTGGSVKFETTSDYIYDNDTDSEGVVFVRFYARTDTATSSSDHGVGIANYGSDEHYAKINNKLYVNFVSGGVTSGAYNIDDSSQWHEYLLEINDSGLGSRYMKLWQDDELIDTWTNNAVNLYWFPFTGFIYAGGSDWIEIDWIEIYADTYTPAPDFDCIVEVTDTKLLTTTWGQGFCNDIFTNANITITHVESGLIYGYDTAAATDEISEDFYPNYAGDYNVTVWAEYDGDWYQFSDEFEFTESGTEIPLQVWLFDGDSNYQSKFTDDDLDVILWYYGGSEILNDSVSNNYCLGYDGELWCAETSAIRGERVCGYAVSEDYYTATVCKDITENLAYAYDVIQLPVYPEDMPANESNVYINFVAELANPYGAGGTGTYIENAYIQVLNSTTNTLVDSCFTNYKGFCRTEVPKNDTYKYRAEKTGYAGMMGTITTTTENVYKSLYFTQIVPTETPTPWPTPTPTPVSTYINDSARNAARETIAELSNMVPGIVMIFLMLLLLSAMKKV